MTAKNTRSPELPSQILYRHVKRPHWGLALLAWDHDEKRGYQFEDGQLRVIKRGYYALLEEVDPPADETKRALRHLGRALGRREALRGSKRELLIPFSEQVSYFKEQFPDGFRGTAWTKKMRGRNAKSALKRHREPAITRAREQLAADTLERSITAQQHDEVVAALLAVLDRTDLVTAAKLKPLRSAPYHRRRAMATALRDLLHGDAPLASRVDAFASSIGKPSWELVTAPLALMYSDQHVCVRPSVFDQQALWMAPRLEAARVPTAAAYERYLRMTCAICERLEEAGLPPRDLMDVHDFICMTLRPAALKVLAVRCREHGARVALPETTDREAA